MWSNSGCIPSPSGSTGSSFTMQVQTEYHGDEIEAMQDMSTMAGSFDNGDDNETKDTTKLSTATGIKSRATANGRWDQRSSTVAAAAAGTNGDYYDNNGDPIKPVLSQCELGPDGSTYICQPYKIELLERQLFTNNPGNARRVAIIETLRTLGVKVYVIDSESTANAEEVLQHVKRVIRYVATENRNRRFPNHNHKSKPTMKNNDGSDMIDTVSSNDATTTLNNNSFQRCLLYLDGQGRLYNLILSSHAIGPASRYMEYLTTFSNMEAIIALTILCRSVPCIFNENTIQNLKPAYLSLVLGLVLTEEISLSWLNASMMIRSTPSVSAHTLYSPVGSDTFRRIVLLLLVFAGIAQGIYQSILTAVGILGASILLLANLGARSWHFLNWKPISYNGPGSFVLAYLCAIVTGLVVPFMGHRLIRTGGKGAVEYIIKTAFWVAVAFVVSDYDGIQKFLVLGSESEQCDQNPVNLTVGVWWTVTLLLSLILVRRIPYRDVTTSTAPITIGERLLIEDHASPVGYKVPSLPDFEMDPTVANTGLPCVSMTTEIVFGGVLAVGVGAVLIGLAFTIWDDDVHDAIADTLD